MYRSSQVGLPHQPREPYVTKPRIPEPILEKMEDVESFPKPLPEAEGVKGPIGPSSYPALAGRRTVFV